MTSDRLTELFKYFRATSTAVALQEDDIDSLHGYRPDLARLAHDPVLNALTQLGAWRLGCDRAFISLIDDEHQYVVAEMTKSISLFDTKNHAENDGICIGTKQLDLVAGICASTMPAFTAICSKAQPYMSTSNVFADNTRYIINNLGLEPQFAERPYVVGYPYMRYYAEVPIRSHSGFVLGTYAILDNKPGNGLSEERFLIMHEISEAIMRHIESIKLQQDYDNALRLIDGLNTFIQSPVDLHVHAQPHGKTIALNVDEGSSKDQTKPQRSDALEVLPTSLSTSTSDHTSSDRESNNASSGSQPIPTTFPSSHDLQADMSSIENPIAKASTSTAANADTASHPYANRSTAVEETPYSTPIATKDNASVLAEAKYACFTRAASILRDAMMFEGVIFLEAESNKSTFRKNDSRKDDVTFRQEVTNHVCKRLGMSLCSVAAQDGKLAPSDQHSLWDETHQALLSLYPNGQVFNFGLERGSDMSPEVEQLEEVDHRLEIHREVRSKFPDATSLIFVPLKNPHTGKWFASCIAWCIQPKRFLEASDYLYLKGFSNSVMTEIARLDLFATNQAKSDFISCISHELRSPLHGILGSTELLKGNGLLHNQIELVAMIENCASILLETMENILHHSKINSAVPDGLQSGRKHEASQDLDRSARISGPVSVFNLGDLIEDTCAALLASHRYSSHTMDWRNSQPRYQGMSSSPRQASDHKLQQNVTMILQMEANASGLVRSRLPAWRRCLLNIIGNALKYTATGYIEIVLGVRPVADSLAPENLQRFISLTIRDTGCGIGASYLENQLFRPFVQENVHSAGTGLGLSIVKSLVDDLQGDVTVVSEVGVGTAITVEIPVELVSQAENERCVASAYSGMTICLVGFNVYLDSALPTIEQTSLISRRALAIKHALVVHCEQWLGMKCSSAPSAKGVSADVIVFLEDDMHHIEESAVGSDNQEFSAQSPTRLIICRDYVISADIPRNSFNQVFYLPQPFGPKQLTAVIAQIYSSRMNFVTPIHDSGQNIRDDASVQILSKARSRSLRTSTPPPRSTLSPAPSPKNVLLVDDNVVNLKLLSRYFEQTDHQYITASNGKEALDAFKQSATPFDYVFMDITMPVMDGFEATRAIRDFEQSAGRTRPTYIVAMTGLGSEDAQKRAVGSGFDIFWTKPVKLSNIKALLKTA